MLMFSQTCVYAYVHPCASFCFCSQHFELVLNVFNFFIIVRIVTRSVQMKETTFVRVTSGDPVWLLLTCGG